MKNHIMQEMLDKLCYKGSARKQKIKKMRKGVLKMFIDTTKQGHEITKIIKYRYRDERKVYDAVIFKRESLNDFNIGLNYDYEDGTWGQGVYDFKTEEEAIKWIIKNKPVLRIY